MTIATLRRPRPEFSPDADGLARNSPVRTDPPPGGAGQNGPVKTMPVRNGLRLDHFGPALVTAVVEQDVELETDSSGGRHWARLAIAIGYRPRIGDVVLAMAAGDAWYVVGVLEGHGPSVVNAPGDLELRAPNGAIRIEAADGCVVAAPAVRVQAAALDLIGETLHEDFDTVRRRISGMLDVRAKAISTTVAETWRLVARRISGRGEENVAIDAPSINLG
jgi:hypothetical protein